jgi:TldD protein
MTRQTNTYFTPGDKSLDELIAMTGEGFLARHAHGGMEDPKGGSLTAGTEYLEEIKEGKLTGRIFKGPSGGHIELSDPVFDLLDRIVAKTSANHPEGIPQNKYGGCGKYHKESVDAGSGGPFILWESVTCG